MGIENESQPPPVRERATFGDRSEAAEFVAMLERFESGEINAEQYRQYRLSRGIYGQRQDGVQMVRVKIPQGVLNAAQMRVLADSAEQYSRGYGHVTTRQNIQFHYVKPEHVGPFMEVLADCGLTTREACSHTVRNVAACALAGVCEGAPFDVTPYGEAITRYFLRAPLGSGLPRKFKMSVSGCPDDCGQAAINDIGAIARVENGRRGFRMLVGGGTATLSRSGSVLHEFLDADELLVACEAILRVFNTEGERKNLQKARMKWAIKRLGWEAFRALYQAHFEAIRDEGGRPFPATAPEDDAPPTTHRLNVLGPSSDARFLEWRRTSVRQQQQAGFVSATLWLRLGDISAVQLRALAKLTERFGDGTARTTQSQNFVVRWIREADASALWAGLDAAGLGSPFAGRTSDVVTCPGAETCRIAVTASRGVAQLVGDHLRERGAEDGRTDGPDIKVSGCPNGCGQNHIAAIGLQGGTRRLGERLVPQYHLTIGGGIDARGATFGRLVGKVPARRVPEAIDRLIAHFDSQHAPGETARAFFQRLETPAARQLLAELLEITAESARPEDFQDLGSDVEFQVVEMDGECAA